MLVVMIAFGLAAARALASDAPRRADSDFAPRSIMKTQATNLVPEDDDASTEGAKKKLKWVPYRAVEKQPERKVRKAVEKPARLEAAAAKPKPIQGSPAESDRPEAIMPSGAKSSDSGKRDRLREQILRAASREIPQPVPAPNKQVAFEDTGPTLEDADLSQDMNMDLNESDSRTFEQDQPTPMENEPRETTPGTLERGTEPDTLPAPRAPSYAENQPTNIEGCGRDNKDCREALRRLKANVISQIDLNIAQTGVEGKDFPCECRLEYEPFETRHWACSIFTWKASLMCHKPLYFEDVHLERYGHSWNPLVQPVMSGAHFFTSVAVLPYKMGMNPPNECIYTLGYYRPGNCAPYLIDPIPLSPRGALFEAGALTGAIFLFTP